MQCKGQLLRGASPGPETVANLTNRRLIPPRNDAEIDVRDRRREAKRKSKRRRARGRELLSPFSSLRGAFEPVGWTGSQLIQYQHVSRACPRKVYPHRSNQNCSVTFISSAGAQQELNAFGTERSTRLENGWKKVGEVVRIHCVGSGKFCALLSRI